MAAAHEIVLEGRTYPADDALRIGLVNRVVADGDLETETKALAATLAAREKFERLGRLGRRPDP